MNALLNLSVTQLKRAVGIKERIEVLQKDLSQVLGLAANDLAGRPARRASKMRASVKARIGAAQRARWAKRRGAPKVSKSRSHTKRGLGRAARAKLAAIARRRWAQAKAAGRTAL
jgi:hypothetical protein